MASQISTTGGHNFLVKGTREENLANVKDGSRWSTFAQINGRKITIATDTINAVSDISYQETSE